MSVERTAAGLQIVIPGCEWRSLPKSRRDQASGQGILSFYKPPTSARKLRAVRASRSTTVVGRSHLRGTGYSVRRSRRGGLNISSCAEE